MDIRDCCAPSELFDKAAALFEEERKINRLDGWFLAKEITLDYLAETNGDGDVLRNAEALLKVIREIPLSISENAVFAGTQRDAFAMSYALINPEFRVDSFSGYCDPSAVFDDIKPNGEFTAERINAVREKMRKTKYVTELSKVYEGAEADTKEVAYFIEQVTGHLIPDFRRALSGGLLEISSEIAAKNESDERKKRQYEAMNITLGAAIELGERYRKIAREQAETASGDRKKLLELIAQDLEVVPKYGAKTLHQAIQSFILLWQVMCIEQAPNPFAFSVGGADRIFEPYREMEGLSREEAAGQFAHFLAFFNVGTRSWAISQNVLLSGRDLDGGDLTNETSLAILDAFYEMNFPQPIMSVKLHKNTPQSFYEELGRFFFSEGVLTPSLFNDDSVFQILKNNGMDESDIPDYSIAGCQEPLIMGKDNGNTTNSWLNLGKILELTLSGGVSTITGERICDDIAEGMTAEERLKNIRKLFYNNMEIFAGRMAEAANGASRALSNLPVPFLSCFMGGLETGIDVRDCERQGTKYNGSGCLIHGLSVVADSFIAIDRLLDERPEDSQALLDALRVDFEGYEDLHKYLSGAPKYGNNLTDVDNEAVIVARKVSDTVRGLKNYLGNPFRPDWASPTTHLLYGYWVGATPDGRKSRDMLNYGVDPLYGEAQNGLGLRVLSSLKLPYGSFNGGYASHMGLDPAYFKGESYREKGVEFKNKIIRALFFPEADKIAPFYLYLNITTPETLRKVLSDPKKYAPSGVYIMRIHGTFVNFLDLAPEIQEDIIKRLDPKSSYM